MSLALASWRVMWVNVPGWKGTVTHHGKPSDGRLGKGGKSVNSSGKVRALIASDRGEKEKKEGELRRSWVREGCA